VREGQSPSRLKTAFDRMRYRLTAMENIATALCAQGSTVRTTRPRPTRQPATDGNTITTMTGSDDGAGPSARITAPFVLTLCVTPLCHSVSPAARNQTGRRKSKRRARQRAEGLRRRVSRVARAGPRRRTPIEAAIPLPALPGRMS